MSAPSISLAQMAEEARLEGRWPDAVMLYRKVVADSPKDADAMCWYAYSLWRNGDLDAAAAEYRKAAAIEPTWAGINNCLGTIERERGDANAALAEYRTALRKSPRYAEAHANLAETLWRQGKLADAAHHFREAAEAKPDWGEMYDDLARVLDELGLYAQAHMAAREAVRLNPQRIASQATLALVLSRLDRHDEAEATIKGLVDIAPDDASLWSRLAWVRWRAKRYDPAKEAAREALWRDANLAYPHFVLGAIAAHRDERDAAIVHYRRYLELDPSDYEGAALGLSNLGAADVPERAPERYMKQLYAKRSSIWDDNVDNNTKYRAPMQIADALERFMGPRGDLDILDVGCGTGLSGPLMRPRARRLDGVDLSAPMLEKAHEKGVYDELIEGDLETVLPARHARYDVIVSAATLIHFGDLRAPLKACAAALKPGGWMGFTVFQSKGGGVGVLPFFCHAHTADHISEAAGDTGFDVVSIEEHVHEYHDGKPVMGLVAVLRRQGEAA